MSLPTTNDITAVDPVLTNLLLGYKQEANRFVADRVFPPVSVANKGGTYYVFDKKYWFTNQAEIRAPGTQFARADFGASTSTYATLQYALSLPVADENRAANQAPMDLERAGVEFLAQKMLLKREIAWATDWHVTGVWGTSGSVTAKFSLYSTSDPIKDIQTAVRTISDNTGYMPNTFVAGYIVQDRLVNHPDILDRIKYTTAAVMGNVENALASVFGLQNWWIGKAVYSNTNEATAFSKTSILDDDLLVCYVNPNPGIFNASAGVTFNWAPGGGMGSADMFRDEPNKADVVRAWAQWDHVCLATDLGYFYADCTD